MKVGVALNMLTKEGRSDASVIGEHVALGDLAEPLGFDSLFALASVKGYEFYGGMAKTYSKMQNDSYRAKATDFYVRIQVVGTPDECIQQLGELQRLTGLDHLVTEFGYGGMPHEEAQANMRLFADRVMPVLQRDRAFAAPTNGTATGVPAAGSAGFFAPA